MIRYLILILSVALLWRGIPAMAQTRQHTTEHQRQFIPLTSPWDYAAEDGTAPPGQWANQLPQGQPITLPPTTSEQYAMLRADGVTWYEQTIATPTVPDQFSPRLVIENAVGTLDIYLDGQPIAHLFGNGLARRIPLTIGPGSSHRLALRLDRRTLPEEMRRADAAGIGPVGIELIPAQHLSMLLPIIDPVHKTVTVRYRVAAGAPGDATLRLEVLSPPSHHVTAHQTVPLTIPADKLSGLDGEITFNVPNVQRWSPESPAIYRLRATLMVANHAIDARETSCGLAHAATLTDNMLSLAEKPYILKGLRLPGGLPLLTRPTIAQTFESEFTLAKQAGFNAIMADGPALPEDAMDVADRLGMMVIGDIPPGEAHGDSAPSPECATAVEELGHHPSLVAWSWENTGLSDATKAEVRQAVSQWLTLPRDDTSSPVATLEAAWMAKAMWSETAKDEWNTRLTGEKPLLITGIGSENADADLSSSSGLQARITEETYLDALRTKVEQIRRARAPIGYFIRPPRGGTVTGLSAATGTRTLAFAAAASYNQPCLLALRADPVKAGDPIQLDAAIINDEELTGVNYQLYLAVVTPDGQTTVTPGRHDVELQGERMVVGADFNAADVLTVPTTAGGGRYQIQLLLMDGRSVVSTAQISVAVTVQ